MHTKRQGRFRTTAPVPRRAQGPSWTTGQGTIEYLVIIGVVVVLALIVVAIIFGLLTSGSDANAKQTRLFWASQEVAIVDSIADSAGNATLVIQNNTIDPITINYIIADGTNSPVISSDKNSLYRGEKGTFNFAGFAACNGTTKAYQLAINYSSNYGLAKSTSTNPLVIDCRSGASNVANFSFPSINNPITGAFPVYTGTDWIVSGTDKNGITIKPDTNAICMNGNSCDANISQIDGNLVFAVK